MNEEMIEKLKAILSTVGQAQKELRAISGILYDELFCKKDENGEEKNLTQNLVENNAKTHSYVAVLIAMTNLGVAVDFSDNLLQAWGTNKK